MGNLDWAASMDFMCEPCQLERTGSTVFEHQFMTIHYYKRIRRAVDPWIHIAPVIQGWTVSDYRAHVEMYRIAGINLRDMPVVGVGSVCRRQDTVEAVQIFTMLRNEFDLTNLHGFGIKREALKKPEITACLRSADSMAWSQAARKRNERLSDNLCLHAGDCRNCRRYALHYREEVMALAA